MDRKDEQIITDGASPIYSQHQTPSGMNMQNIIPPPHPQVYYYPQVNPSDIDSIEKKNKKYIKNMNKHLDYSKEYSYSVTFLVIGIFFFLPLLFNIIYLRSPNNKARNIAFSSLIVASVYFIVGVIIMSIVIPLNEEYYYRRYDY